MTETFIKFLKDNDFYDAWMSAYELDNKLYDNIVSLDEFFKRCPTSTWLYNGIGAMAFELPKEYVGTPELRRQHKEWREKYLSKYIKLDEKWMDLVQKLL